VKRERAAVLAQAGDLATGPDDHGEEVNCARSGSLLNGLGLARGIASGRRPRRVDESSQRGSRWPVPSARRDGRCSSQFGAEFNGADDKRRRANRVASSRTGALEECLRTPVNEPETHAAPGDQPHAQPSHSAKPVLDVHMVAHTELACPGE
jgi:hypothetical protein